MVIPIFGKKGYELISRAHHSGNSNRVADDIGKGVGKFTQAINLIIYSTFSANSHEYIHEGIYIHILKILLKEHWVIQKNLVILGR